MYACTNGFDLIYTNILLKLFSVVIEFLNEMTTNNVCVIYFFAMYRC